MLYIIILNLEVLSNQWLHAWPYGIHYHKKSFIVAIMYIKFIKYTKLCDKYNSVSKLAACNCSNSD